MNFFDIVELLFGADVDGMCVCMCVYITVDGCVDGIKVTWNYEHKLMLFRGGDKCATLMELQCEI